MSKQMKKRIFSGQVCEQIVYSVHSNTGDQSSFDPERQQRKRFEDQEAYELFKLSISKRKHSRQFNENFVPGDPYATLTFNDEWEVHTFKEAKVIRKNFTRALHRKYPNAVVFLYMGRGKGTNRIHFHMVAHGIPQEFIIEKWKYGSVVHLRGLRKHNYYDGVDHGADFTGLANYLFDHWTKEVGGHRWYQSKDARKPETEKPKKVGIKDGYSKKRAPRTPEGYKLVKVEATKYGCLYFKYVRIPEDDVQQPRAKKKPTESRLN